MSAKRNAASTTIRGSAFEYQHGVCRLAHGSSGFESRSDSFALALQDVQELWEMI